MSESNRVQLLISAESTWAETPTTPTMKQMRITSDSMQHNKTTVRSQELRSDRQVPDWIETQVAAAGGFNFELSAGSFLDLFQGVLANTQGTVSTGAVANVDIVAAAGTYTRGAGDWTAAGIKPGMLVNFAGSADTDNNGNKMVDTVTDTVITVNAGSRANMGNTTGESITVTGKEIVNGTTKFSYLIEKGFLDIASTFVYFTGCRVGSMNLNFTAGALVTGAVEFMGNRGFTKTSSWDASPDAASTTSVLSGSSHMGTIYRNGVALANQIQSIQLSINGNPRGPAVLGQKGAGFINYGSFAIEGTLGVYFEGLTLTDDFVNHANTDLWWTVADSVPNTQAFRLPVVKFMSDGTPVAGGIDQDVLVNYRIGAQLKPAAAGITTPYTIVVSGVGAGA